MVEVWIDRHPDGEWYANVKGEVDLDNVEAEDYCVLNDERTVDNAQQAAHAIREIAEMVVAYPLPELLAMRWPPEDHEVGGESAEPIGSFIRTVTVTRKQPDDDPPR